MIQAGRLSVNHPTTTSTFTAQRTPRTVSTMTDNNSDDDDGGGGKPRNKSRRELPTGAVATLKAWLLSPEHFTHPYPTPQDQVMLMQKTGIDKKQLKNWFTNARRRIWKPMLKKQLEQGKLATTGTGGGVAVPGVVPGLMVSSMPGQPAAAPIQAPVQEVRSICTFVNVRPSGRKSSVNSDCFRSLEIIDNFHSHLFLSNLSFYSYRCNISTAHQFIRHMRLPFQHLRIMILMHTH